MGLRLHPRWLGGLMGLALAWCAAAAEPPSEGPSLFEEVFAGSDGRPAIPFPFQALLTRLGQELAPGQTALRGGLPLVLIPLGRSLQRHAAEEAGYFAHPRVVVAVTGEPRPGAPLLKDRLYIGYHDLAGVLEVVSYNESAGRFDFLLVRDYRPGGKPRLVEGRRELCLACHQDAAPIFSRQTWDETGANPVVGRLLEAELAPNLSVLPWRGGVDVPNAIDDATERAIRLNFAQRLWREGCGAGPAGAACRGELLRQAVLLRLSREAADPASETLAPLLGRWPQGLAVGNPDIPNRLPLDPDARPPPTAAQVRRAADVAAPFDPLAPRPVRDRWDPASSGAGREAAAAVGLFLAAPDLAAIDRALARANRPAADRPEALRRAVAAMAAEEGGPLAAGPLDRRRVVPGLLRHLGAADPRCCGPARRLAALEAEPPRPAPAGLSAEMATLFRRCGACHDSHERFPPGFLAGEGEGLRRRVAGCAPRMAYRLAMATVAEAKRPKTPMPPPASVHAAGFADSAEYRVLMAWLPALAGQPLDTLLQSPYADLPPCRPVFD